MRLLEPISAFTFILKERFYDITPLDASRQQNRNDPLLFDGTTTVTLTTSTAHGAEAGDIILLDGVSGVTAFRD